MKEGGGVAVFFAVGGGQVCIFSGYLEAGEWRVSAPLNFSMNDETSLYNSR